MSEPDRRNVLSERIAAEDLNIDLGPLGPLLGE